MKKISLVLALFVSFAAVAQKEIKPNVGSAEKALRAGKLDEAKAIIDVTTASQEYMVDKKGNPSKNAAKSWFVKGIVYAALDTTSNAKFKTLVADGFPIAKEAFDKAAALDPSNGGFLRDPVTGFPEMNTQISAYLAQAYFNTAIKAYQDDKDYKKAFEFTERTLYFIPNDTAILMNAGVFFGPAAEEYDKALDYIKKYQEKGGTSSDAYVMLFSIYRDKKKDNEAALKIAQEMVKKFPGNSEFPRYELDMYVKMDRLPEAKSLMEKQVAANPADKESRYLLGVINFELKNNAEARKWYEEALKLDDKYFEAQIALADIVYIEAKKVKSEMNQLGNSKEDFKKKVDLDKVYQEKLRVALPFWEKAEKLSPDDSRVLDALYIIYNDLEMTAQVTRVEKKMKTLGLLD